MVVHVDSLEPKDLIGTDKTLGMIAKVLGPDQVIVRRLDSADFAFWDQDGCSLGIERKAGLDLTSSLSTKRRQSNGNVRLLNQLSRMKLEYTHQALLLEGPTNYVPNEEGGGWWSLGVNKHGLPLISGWNWLSMMMQLWSWEQDGLTVFYVPSKDLTVELLRGLNNRANVGCVTKGIRTRKKK